MRRVEAGDEPVGAWVPVWTKYSGSHDSGRGGERDIRLTSGDIDMFEALRTDRGDFLLFEPHRHDAAGRNHLFRELGRGGIFWYEAGTPGRRSARSGSSAGAGKIPAVLSQRRDL